MSSLKPVDSDNVPQDELPLINSVIDISVKIPWKLSRIKVLKTTTDHIVTYNSRDLSLSRAICAISYSFLCHKKSWLQVILLNFIVVFSYLVTSYSGVASSLSDTGDTSFSYTSLFFFLVQCQNLICIQYFSEVTKTLQLLLTFILASYVGLAISRWNKLRHDALHPLFIGMENTVQYAYRIFDKDTDRHRYLRNCVFRYSRLSFKTLIMAVNGKSDLRQVNLMFTFDLWKIT